jgi:hypothetical protein
MIGHGRKAAAEMAVVDPKCRVIGVNGLKVADSSIFPRITNGNLNAPSIMVGEKASDHILDRQPLPGQFGAVVQSALARSGSMNVKAARFGRCGQQSATAQEAADPTLGAADVAGIGHESLLRFEVLDTLGRAGLNGIVASGGGGGEAQERRDRHVLSRRSVAIHHRSITGGYESGDFSERIPSSRRYCYFIRSRET